MADLIDYDKRKQILELLKEVESRNRVTIIHAIESGSRAWGFPSRDSDYDLRFIYHHPRDWYITAFEKKDTIELAFKYDLDAAGWDIAKCLRLLYKGNAPLYEWLFSPVIYRQSSGLIKHLQDLSMAVFNPKASAYHYLSLAKKKLLNEKTAVNAKSFLYALRAVLCAQWIAEDHTPPPVDAHTLFTRFLPEAQLQTLLELIHNKQTQMEKDSEAIDSELLQWTKTRYSQLADVDIPAYRQGDAAMYGAVLLKILNGE